MKENHAIRGEELERVSEELFGTFDPGDEPFIGGGWDTITSRVTFSGSSYDSGFDIDWSFEEVKPVG
jgi:hypothetical protein